MGHSPENYYNSDVGTVLPGAGPLGYIVGDQLHPPMVDDEKLWREGRWHEGAVRHTIEAASLCSLRPGDTVLDVGCGVGGPARTLVDHFGVKVLAVNISEVQLRTCAELNATEQRWKQNISLFQHDCLLPYPWKNLDCAISLNMLYHVPDHKRMLLNIFHALRPGGQVLLDDWMLTPLATEADRQKLSFHFVSRSFAVTSELVDCVAAAGFVLHRQVDLGFIARTHLAKYFLPVFDAKYRHQVEKAYGEYGKETALQFIQAIQASIQLYQEQKLTYARLVAQKPEE